MLSEERKIKKCQNCEKDFSLELEDFNFYEKMKVPSPTFCIECRFQRKILWRNERNFYHRICDMCGDKVISIYKNKDIKIFCQKCYFSEKWEAGIYGQNYDFNKPFFEQFKELFLQVPQVNLNGHASNINSPYVNYVVQVKNSYFCFGGGFSENILFSNLGVDCKDSMEIYFSTNCEFCYEIFNCNRCNLVFWGNNLKDCMESYFIQDCVNCSDCIMCCNLNNKKFCYKNEQYSQEEYQKIKENFLNELKSDLAHVKEEFFKFLISKPKKYSNILKSKNCSGNNIVESNNVKNSFNIKKGEGLKNCVEVLNQVRDIYDSVSVGLNVERIYEVLTGSVNISNVLFSCIVRSNSMNIQYSYFLTSCSNCFGCVGLSNKSYCIFNKQYTKEEYEELIPKIIKHMNDMPYIDQKNMVYKYGEFFPSELSPFYYNETIAQEYFPLTKEEVVERGYKWRDKEERNYNLDIKNEDIPSDIKNINEGIVGKIIECSNKGNEKMGCTEAFKIIETEFQFYKRMNLPLPRFCPNCRHFNRLKQRNFPKLWHRYCMHEGCHNEFETSYSPDRPEIVYCEECYRNEVY